MERACILDCFPSNICSDRLFFGKDLTKCQINTENFG